jgi:two-component system NtrC family sensor kinase
MHKAAYQRHAVEVIREFEDVPEIIVDRHKVLQILVNLFHNAKYACEAARSSDRKITVRIGMSGADHVKIHVSDNGMGIAPENLTRIFSHGFTTRKNGHGFGLHSGALAAKEMGGSLKADSAGIGKGATFTLELPLQSKGARPAHNDKIREPESLVASH